MADDGGKLSLTGHFPAAYAALGTVANEFVGTGKGSAPLETFVYFNHAIRSEPSMINTFQHKGLKKLFEQDDRRGIANDLVERLTLRLDYLDAATTISDLDLPGYKLHQLKGDRKGVWSIHVSGNWRLTFTFRDGEAFDVALEDYH